MGKCYVVFGGWPSVEKHKEFRKSADFGRAMGKIKEGVVGVKVWHVGFEEVKGGGEV
jgi:hypothetical protein